MKYVCISYDEVPTNGNHSAKVLIFSDSDVTNKVVIGQQLFITCNDKTYTVVYNSDSDSNVTDFATVLRVGYQGSKAYTN